jgi:hypothetical protein
MQRFNLVFALANQIIWVHRSKKNLNNIGVNESGPRV